MTSHTHTSTSISPFAEQLQSDLPRVMSEVLFGLLGDHDEDFAAPAADGFLGCRVTIRGGFQGEVIVSATLGLASCIAEQMFEDELDGKPTYQDARDALREVSNIIAGNLKPLFGENNQLGLPEDLADNQNELPNELATSTLEHPSGVLKVVVRTVGDA
jgi:hypothetical protein